MKKVKKIIVIAVAFMIIQSIILPTKVKASFIDNILGALKINAIVMGAGTETDPILTTGVDISKNGDGSVIAKLSEDQTTLTITGTGEMKIFPSSDKIPWENYKNYITTAEIGEGVTSIANYAFYKCSSLSSITIPEGVTSIGNNSFRYCSSLSSIRIPEGVTSIGREVFAYCRSLKSITIPEGVKSIPNWIFCGCSSLSRIDIPNSVTCIECCAFSNCSSLSSIIIPKGVTSIEENAFAGCSSLSSITIPEGVTSIEDLLFANCSSLNSITIPKGVTSIGREAFHDCSSLSGITIPEGVTSIENSAFSGCSSLSSITIPEGVTSIGRSAFNRCSSLSSIIVDSNNAKYMSEDGVLFNKEKTIIIKYPSKRGGSSYIIPEGVTSIANSAFSGCSSLSSITIPEKVTSIEIAAFSGCSSLSSITIPKGVTSIGSLVFDGCGSLSSITIPEGVTSIEDYAFRGCYSLSSIDIPNGVASIGEHAFDGCRRLSSIDIPSSATSIGEHAFNGCIRLTSIIIPEGVTSIGKYAFHYCSNLERITIPDSVTSIGEGAFYTDFEGPEVVSSKGLTIICKSNTEAENYAKKYQINYITDDIAPRMTVSPESAKICKSTNITITAADNEGGTGLSSGNSYQYYLSTSSTTLSGGSWKDYTTGTAFTAGTGLTGTYFLFVKRVNDNVGNVSTTNGTPQEIDGTTYQRFGSYVFDNTAPTLSTISVTSPDTGYYKSGQTITIVADYRENLGEKIYGTANKDEITSANAPILTLAFGGVTGKTNNGVTTFRSASEKTITYTYQIADGDNGVLSKSSYIGTVYDEVGNSQTSLNGTLISGKTITADNTAPVITVSPSSMETCRTANVTITLEDEHSGVLTSENSCQYYLSTSDRSLSGGSWKDYTSGTAFTAGTGLTGTYYLFVKRANDNVGNISTTNGTLQEIDGIIYQRFGSYVFDNTALTVESTTYKIEKDIISQVQPKTTVEDLKSKINTNATEITVIDKDKKIVGEKTVVGTGMKIVFNGTDAYTLVVLGDVNGDGKADIKDIMEINKHRLKKKSLTSEYLKAGDVNKDETVNIKDILKVNKYRLRKITEL